MKSIIKKAAQYFIISLLAALILLIYTFPNHPTTWPTWIALFGLALPILLTGEYIGDLLLERNSASRAIEKLTQEKAFSWVRIGYFLLVFLVVGAAFVALIHWLKLSP